MGAVAVRTEKPKNKKSRKQNMADTADRHALYEESVQSVDSEYTFVSNTFQKLRGRRPRHMREDFCGTAGMCCEWVSRDSRNTAIGVDFDPEVLDWGRKNNLARLKPAARRRVTLIQEDVCRVSTARPAEAVLAMNFSYQFFMTRKKMRTYMRKVRESLADDGIFFMDAFGGYDAYREKKEKTRYKGFTYIWEQESYNPIDGHMRFSIHFAFPDGSKLKKAFSYTWRMWTLPDLQELLIEAGFSRVTVYWEEADPDSGEGTGDYSPSTRGSADPVWVCFLVAEK